MNKLNSHNKFQVHICSVCYNQWGAWVWYDKEIGAWRYEDEEKAVCSNGHGIDRILIME